LAQRHKKASRLERFVLPFLSLIQRCITGDEPMPKHSWIGLFAATSVGLGFLTAPVAQGVQLADGTVYFDHPPTLDNATTSRDTAAAAGATYYFTLIMPDDAGEPLKTVAIAQYEGDSITQRVEFDADESFAFVGTPRHRGDEIALSDASYDEDTRTIQVSFATPVPPATTVTVAVRPDRNPLTEGVYLFGVTAYPDGDLSYGQFLGYGRLQFIRLNDFSLWDW
jgi:hypothetical protein